MTLLSALAVGRIVCRLAAGVYFDQEEAMHYAMVLVLPKGISATKEEIHEILLPYKEHDGDLPKKFLEFCDEEKEERQKYENEGSEMVKMPDGRYLTPWDDEFKVPGAIGWCSDGSTHKVPEHLKIEQVPYCALFVTFEDYMREWNGHDERDSETGKYGHWSNPNGI